MENKRSIASIKGIIVILIVFAVAILLMAIYSKNVGQYIIIEKNGDILYKINLVDNQEMIISGEDSNTVTVKIEDGAVRVVSSDCPDKTCVRMGRISKAGEKIICLPARISIEIEGKGSADALTG